ncbi:DUF2683 family protein [Mucilaginibacter sp.]|uniref:DUF2683 family protein n=1 Tax=Mucilaginibacter sp. TaxID=1882438 RepID=UPI0039C8D38C
MCVWNTDYEPTDEEQSSALKAIAKAWKISIETSPYNPDFVGKIKESKKQAETRKFTILDPAKSVWDNLK